MDTYIGFDSAWTDNPGVPGAICAIELEGARPAHFHAPELVSFAQAFAFIQQMRASDGVTLVALDQPSVVPNMTSMRPVDRVAASLMGWLGGGVQPANRGRLGMFCDASPIWGFLSDLNALQEPEQARSAVSGLYLIEVFPALALASLDPGFCKRLGGPRYNPLRAKTFRLEDWVRVADAVARESAASGCEDLAQWCRNAKSLLRPRKADQDKLDAALCALIGLRWRIRPRGQSVLLGDVAAGYMVSPASPAVRERLTSAGRKFSVPIDGLCQDQV